MAGGEGPQRRRLRHQPHTVRCTFICGNLELALPPRYQQASEIYREVGNKEGEGLNYNVHRECLITVKVK